MTGTRIVVLYLLLVFVLGCALGALAMLWAGKQGWVHIRWSGEEEGPPSAVRWLTRELKLTPDQRQQLETVLEDTSRQYFTLFQPVEQQYMEVRNRSRDRIRAFLTGEQREKFEELVRSIDQHEKEMREKFGASGPGVQEDPAGKPERERDGRGGKGGVRAVLPWLRASLAGTW